uniref:Myozenin 3a n=1 Tax=Erpetoichthys calabaricus TaxID=27687 RepID=A0A8C4SW57_ERPCA
MPVPYEQLNLGKKISVPRDVMMEELGLLSNKASRMFHERQKRADKFILERVEGNRPVTVNAADVLSDGCGEHPLLRGGVLGRQHKEEGHLTPGQTGEEGSHWNVSFFLCLISPGYSGPLKKIPHEKFNVTVIPKSYRSPWTKNVEIVSSVTLQLPEPPQKPATFQFRCFNRYVPSVLVSVPSLSCNKQLL